jgi:type I restriction enzyme S subunit
MKWPIVQLKDCARIVGGATPKSEIADYWNGDIPWTTPKDLSDLDGKFLTDTPRKITELGLRNCSSEVLPPNSVLFSSRAPIGHVAINTVPMATNQGFKSMVPGPRLDASFLYWWLKCHRSELEQLGNGATFKEVSKAVVERVEIPLPPLDEQKRIAAILDQADDLRRKRQRALDRLNQLGQAIFIEMFGDPGTNPMRWRERPLGEMAAKFSDGPFGSNLKSEHYVEQGVRVIRLQNIGVDEFLDKDKAFISEAHFRSLANHACVPGDVIVGTMGVPNLRACLLPGHLGLALNKADCVQIRPNVAVASRFFICGLLNHPSTERMAHDLILGQTRARISMGRLRGLRVPCPPLALQEVFGLRIERLEELRSDYEEAQAASQTLFASLQDRAFRGALTASSLKEAIA